MKINNYILTAMIIILMVSFASVISAEDNSTTVNITTTNTTSGENNSIQDTFQDNASNTTIVADYGTISNNITNTTNTTNTSTTTTPIEQNNQTTNEMPVDIEGVDLISILPDTFNVGDIQLSIELQNNGTITLNNVPALVSGKGFSTYNIISIPLLEPKQTGYVIVMGNFKQGGELPLTIKVNDFTFKYNVTVVDSNKATETAQDIEQKNANIQSLTSQLQEFEQKYRDLEQQFHDKKRDKYDVADINIADLKTFLTNTRTALLTNDIVTANASFDLVQNEYAYQKTKLDKAQIIEESFSQTLKNNAVLISSIAGAIIMLFTLYELLKKKKESLKKVIDVNIRLTKNQKQEESNKLLKKGKEKAKKEEHDAVDPRELQPDDDVLEDKS
ncbi:hypothetical protein HYY69_08410 [Candidatus Woesearchaeota archaeon]|nr:hypothetical protein [Candidatus Woesearchaeota archaeon]